MSLIYKVGGFLFYFGLVLAIISMTFIAVFKSLSLVVPIRLPDLMDDYARMFVFTAPMSFLLAILAGQVVRSIGGILGVFLPQLTQASTLGIIIVYFVPTYSAIASAITLTISILPLPVEVKASIASVILTVAAFTMIYYFAVKIGAAPVL